MHTYTSGEQLLSFLDRVALSYPGGIPKRAIKAVDITSHRCALLCVGSGQPLSDHLTALAQAICVKGLRLPVNECAIQSIGVPNDGELDLASLVSGVRASHVIVCGGNASPGTLLTVEGVEVLRSYELERIATDAAIKRQFWEHLQLIIPRIHRRDG